MACACASIRDAWLNQYRMARSYGFDEVHIMAHFGGTRRRISAKHDLDPKVWNSGSGVCHFSYPSIGGMVIGRSLRPHKSSISCEVHCFGVRLSGEGRVRLLRLAIATIELAVSGYPLHRNWSHTRIIRESVDARGNPIPWFTYAAIDFLNCVQLGSLRVCEYGGGNGTLWWAQRCLEVVVIEHDPQWLRASSTMNNVRPVVCGADAASYVHAPDFVAPFDVVVVDGLFRAGCLAHSHELCTDRGVIILDDAHRSEYAEGRARLLELGWRSVPFTGMQPISKHEGCTEIFYRPGNVFGI